MSPVAPDGAVNKRQLVMGWVAVAISVLLGAFVGVFAGGEGVTEGWAAFLAHLAQLLVVVLLALVCVRWPRVGGSLLVLAGVGVGLGFRFDVSDASSFYRAFFYVTLIVVGLLYFFGKPSPRRLAYALVVGVPVAVTALAALLGTLFKVAGLIGS